jgi:CDP-glycerol glycerophosphotransferase
VSEPHELFAEIADLDGLARTYAKQRRGFIDQYGEYDTGNAAKQVVDRFFTGERSA